MATSLDVFRFIAAEFSVVDDETVITWLDMTAPLVSRKRFGKMYQQALALLTAHRMKTANAGVSDNASDGDLSDVGGVGTAFKVGSYSSGGESVSFNTSALTSRLSPDAEYTQTVYGVQYLTLRNLNIIPVINAGEGG